MWSYFGHSINWNCYIWLATVNHKDCHFKFQSRSCDANVIRKSWLEKHVHGCFGSADCILELSLESQKLKFW